MADATTTTYSFTKPEVGASEDSWGGKLNANWDSVDDLLDGTTAITPNLGSGWEVGGVAVTATAAELNALDGLTATTAELNILDGVTATAAEINLLDGVTATTTEINYVDGVTSAIQTQLDAKAPLASPTFTGTPTVPTAAEGTNTTQAASTAFVTTAVAGAASNGIDPDAEPVATPRTNSTSYQNTTGFHMPVFIPNQQQFGTVQVSSDNSTWVTVVDQGSGFGPAFTIVPPGWYYRASLTASGVHEYRAP